MENQATVSEKETQKINKQLKTTTSAMKQLGQLTKDWGDNIKHAATAWYGFKFAEQLSGIVDTMIKTNSELHRIAVNSGNGAAGAAILKKQVNELSISLGATHEQANKVIKTLASKQYAGSAENINIAAQASFAFAKALNLDETEITATTVELQKWGQITAETTRAMYTDIMKVAQGTGLTSEAAKEVIQSTAEWSGTLKAFGKSSVDVQKYNMSLAKTVSALEKVGVSANKARSMLEDLIDPTNIEENIPKFAALGISITDAINGEITGEKFGEGLKEFGEKLKTMGPIAGAAYAKAMGVSYKDAIKASSADFEQAAKVDLTPEQKAEEEMKKAMSETMDLTEKIQGKVSAIGGIIRNLGPLVLSVVSIVGPSILRNIDTIRDKFTSTIKETTDYAKSEMDKMMGIDLSKGTNTTLLNISEMRKQLVKESTELEQNFSKAIKNGMSKTDIEAQFAEAKVSILKEKDLKLKTAEELKKQYENLKKQSTKDLTAEEKASYKTQTELAKKLWEDAQTAAKKYGLSEMQILEDNKNTALKMLEDYENEQTNKINKRIQLYDKVTGKISNVFGGIGKVLSKPLVAASGALNKLGISSKDVLNAVKKTAVFLVNPFEAILVTSKLIGKVGSGLIKGLASTVKFVKNNIKNIPQIVGNIKDGIANIASSIGKNFKNAFEVAKNAGTKVLGGLSATVKFAAQGMLSFFNKDIAGRFAVTFENLKKKASDGIGKFFGNIKDGIINIAGSIGKNFKNAFEVAKNAGTKMFGGLTTAAKFVADGMLSFFNKDAAGRFAVTFENLKKKASDGIGKVFDKIKNKRKELFPPTMFTDLKNNLKESLKGGFDNVKDLWGSLKEKVKSILPDDGIKGIGKGFGTILKTFSNGYSKLFSVIPKSIKALKTGLKEVGGEFKKKLGEAANGFKKAMKDPLGSFKNLFKKREKTEKTTTTKGGGIAILLGALLALLGPLIAILEGDLQEPLQEIVEVFSPAVKALSNGIKKYLPYVKKIAEDLMNSLSEAFEGLKPVLEELMLTLVTLLGAIGKVLGPVLKFIGTVLSAAMKIIMPVLDALIGIISTVLESLSPLFSVLTDLINVAMAILPIQPILEFVGKALMVVSSVIGGLISIAVTISKTILGFIPAFIKFVSPAVNKIVSLFKNLFNFKEMFGGFKNGLISGFKQLFLNLPTIRLFRIVLDKLKSFKLVNSIIEAGKNLFSFLIKLTPAHLIYNLIKKFIEKFGDRIKSTLSPIIKRIQGMLKAINDFKNKIIEKIKEIIDKLPNWIKRKEEAKKEIANAVSEGTSGKNNPAKIFADGLGKLFTKTDGDTEEVEEEKPSVKTTSESTVIEKKVESEDVNDDSTNYYANMQKNVEELKKIVTKLCQKLKVEVDTNDIEEQNKQQKTIVTAITEALDLSSSKAVKVVAAQGTGYKEFSSFYGSGD